MKETRRQSWSIQGQLNALTLASSLPPPKERLQTPLGLLGPSACRRCECQRGLHPFLPWRKDWGTRCLVLDVMGKSLERWGSHVPLIFGGLDQLALWGWQLLFVDARSKTASSLLSLFDRRYGMNANQKSLISPFVTAMSPANSST